MVLVWGTANPEGLKDSYRGVYLNRSDIAGMVEQVQASNARGAPIPVKLEHAGAPMGRVVSAWESGAGRCTGFDKMSKVFHFWVNSTILKRISNSIQNFTGFGAFNTIKSQWSGGRVQVQVQVFSLSL